MNALFNQWDVVVILLQIIAIDLLLGGDNAVVIAMACRKLPPEQRTKAIVIGTFGAILARVLLLAIAVYLLSLPWLKIVGALLLLWIGIKLVAHQDEDEEIGSSGSLWRTAVTITVADVIMSMDNVLAVAAAGKGHLLLVALGVLISIPIIVAGSKLVLAILNRFPVVILLGGALIGWIAGSMWVTDPTIVRLFPRHPMRYRLSPALSARRWCCWKDFVATAGHARPAERPPLTDAVNPDGVKFPPDSFPTCTHLP
jgi:YjbE family integral membrane protein